MKVPLPTGFLAGGRGAGSTMVGTEDTPSIFTGNLDIAEISGLNLLRSFDRGH